MQQIEMILNIGKRNNKNNGKNLINKPKMQLGYLYSAIDRNKDFKFQTMMVVVYI